MVENSNMEKDYYEPTDSGAGTGVGSHTGFGEGTTGHMSTGGTSTMEEKAKSVTDQAGEVASKAQAKASEMGTKAQEKADVGMERASEGLHKAAENMRSRFESQEGVQAQVGTKVASGIESAASYLEGRDSAELWAEFESFVKEHPMQAAAGALFAGWMLGRIMR